MKLSYLNSGTDGNGLVWVDSLGWNAAEELLARLLDLVASM